MEIDITDKVKRMAKYSVAGVLMLSLSTAGLVLAWQSSNRYIALRDVEIVGDLVKVQNKVPGEITKILVGDGEKVEVGQTLAKMRVKILPEQMEQLKKSVETAKARYNEILTRPAPTEDVRPAANSTPDQAPDDALNRAKQEKEKMDKLFAIGGISQRKHSEAVAQYESELQRYQSAKSRQSAAVTNEPTNAISRANMLKLAELQVKQAEAALLKAESEQIIEIKATVDGLVYLTKVQLEEELAAQQDIFVIGNAREVWLEAPVNEGQRGKISLGQFVQYTVTEYPQLRLYGTVYEIIDPGGETDQSDKKKSRIRISIPSDVEIQLKPGMKANAKISV